MNIVRLVHMDKGVLIRFEKTEDAMEFVLWLRRNGKEVEAEE